MRLWVLCLAATASTACVTASSARVNDGPDEWRPWPGARAPPTPPAKTWARTGRGDDAAAIALELVGLPSLYQASPFARALPDDCTGLVRFAWEQLGVDLFAGYTLAGESGVAAMYRVANERGTFFVGVPRPGDLVFFRETYDRNRDGRYDDGLTHVAIVVDVAANGTVSFVHRSGHGITRGAVTVAEPHVYRAPDGTVRNDYLRPKSRLGPAMLTGELFVGYARPASTPVAVSAR